MSKPLNYTIIFDELLIITISSFLLRKHLPEASAKYLL